MKNTSESRLNEMFEKEYSTSITWQKVSITFSLPSFFYYIYVGDSKNNYVLI